MGTGIQYRNIIINSTVLFIIASILTMTLHECGHFFAALATGALDVKLFHNSVTYSIDGQTSAELLFIAASGPNISLLIGLFFHYVCATTTSRNMNFLFALYMAVFGYIGCFGYIMVSPFFSYGDTGFICYLLDVPVWLTFVFAICGAVFMFLLMKSLTRYFVEMGTAAEIENQLTRVRFVNAIIVYPLIIGIVITTLLNFPVPTFLSLLAPLCSPFTILWTYGYARNKIYRHPNYNANIQTIDKLDFLWMLVLVLVVNMNRMLTGGIGFN